MEGPLGRTNVSAKWRAGEVRGGGGNTVFARDRGEHGNSQGN